MVGQQILFSTYWALDNKLGHILSEQDIRNKINHINQEAIMCRYYQDEAGDLAVEAWLSLSPLLLFEPSNITESIAEPSEITSETKSQEATEITERFAFSRKQAVSQWQKILALWQQESLSWLETSSLFGGDLEPQQSFSKKIMVRNIIVILIPLLFYVSCSTTEKRFLATGVRQAIYRKKTDLLLTELYYPVTGNANLDGLLRERIWAKYQTFRKQLDDKILDYLNEEAAFTYRATFDALRSPDLYIISFVLYETWEVQTVGESNSPNFSPNFAPNLNTNSNRKNLQDLQDMETDSNNLVTKGNNQATTQAEVFLYALKFGSVVDFLMWWKSLDWYWKI